jgi:hypothetical protein
LEVNDEAHSSTQIPGRNRRKTPQIVKSKNRAKNTYENHEKWKTLQLKIGEDLAQTHGCIDANQESTRCENQPNISPLFRRSDISLTSLLSSL